MKILPVFHNSKWLHPSHIYIYINEWIRSTIQQVYTGVYIYIYIFWIIISWSNSGNLSAIKNFNKVKNRFYRKRWKCKLQCKCGRDIGQYRTRIERIIRWTDDKRVIKFEELTNSLSLRCQVNRGRINNILFKLFEDLYVLYTLYYT